jgi:phenylpropionate dioxygenase-like ring-hydroxylating dioxygenase large terminal subunit
MHQGVVTAAMTMSAALIDAIKRRAETEGRRSAYPAAFPALPGVPAARYRDLSFAALEAEAVFGRSWLFVAHTDELAEPGDYRLVDQLPQPIMLVRGGDGELRAFYNTCKHRGAALVSAPSGNAGRRLACPYHNWVYSLEGGLLGYPEPANFSDLDRDCHALTPIRCETWGPLVFINLDVRAPSLRDYLGPVGSDLSEFDSLAGRLRLAKHTVREVPVNWKVPVDANIETYHVNYVHRDTAARSLDQAATGIQLLANGHSRMLIRTNDGLDLDPGFPPLLDGVGDLPVSGTFSYHVFPNLSIVFSGPGFVFFITNWPTGPSTSSYRVHWCSSLAPDDPANRSKLDRFIELTQTVLFEDLTVLPGIQTSIGAGTLETVRLSYQERRIYHLHEAIDRAIGAERVPEPLRVPQLLGPFVEA